MIDIHEPAFTSEILTSIQNIKLAQESLGDELFILESLLGKTPNV